MTVDVKKASKTNTLFEHCFPDQIPGSNDVLFTALFYLNTYRRQNLTKAGTHTHQNSHGLSQNTRADAPTVLASIGVPRVEFWLVLSLGVANRIL